MIYRIWAFITWFWTPPLIFIPISIFYLLVNDILIIIHLIVFLLVLETICTFIKFCFFKERPKKLNYTNIIWKLLASSFPSLHTSRTFGIFLFSFIYSFNYSTYFFVFALLIWYSRIFLKKHYLGDVVWGILITIIIFFVYQKYLFVYVEKMIDYLY